MPQRSFGSTIIHQFKIKPRRPLKKVFFVLRSSFFVLRSSFFVHRSFKIKPRRPLKKAPSFIIRSSKIKPQRPFGSTNVDKSIHIQPFFKIKPKSP
ncbi:hypothetical protein ACFX2C_008724 [Malus domestica]